MPGLIEHGGGQIFGGAEALPPLLGGPDRRDDLGRQRLAGLDVPGVILQDLRPQDPHLVHLAGVLDEIARHIGSRTTAGSVTWENKPCRAWPNSWNSVRTSSRLSRAGSPAAGRGRLSTLTTTGTEFEQERLVDEIAHPGAAALALAGEIVAQEQPDGAAVGVPHLPDPDIRVIADQVGPADQFDAIEPGRRIEDAIAQHPLEVEIGAQGGGIDVILLGPDPLGVVRPVPWRELDAVPPGQFGEQRRLGIGVVDGRADQPAEEFVDRRGRLDGLVGHLGIGVGGEPQQPGPLRPQGHDLQQHLAVVVLAGVRPVDRCLEQPAANVPIAQQFQQRLTGRQDQRDGIAAGVTTGGGGIGGRRDGVGAEAGQLIDGVDQHDRVLGGLQQVLLEGGGQGGQPLVQLRQLRPARPRRAPPRPARSPGDNARPAWPLRCSSFGSSRSASNTALTLAYSAGSSLMPSECAVSFGAYSDSMARSCSVELVELRLKNTAETLLSS